MSKHLGNVLEPIAADGASTAPTRCAGSCSAAARPWSARRVGHERARGDRPQGAADLLEHRVLPHAVRRRERLGAGRRPAPGVADRPLLDRWALSELHRDGAPRSTAALEDFDTAAGRRAAGRVRRRPVQLVRPAVAPPVLGRRPGRARDAARVPRGADPAAGAVHAVRHRRGVRDAGAPRRPDAARLGAPARPGREVDGALRRRRRWPRRSALVRRLVELGRSARAESKVKTRQPLGRALVGAAGWAALPDELRAQVADELNVAVARALGRRRRPGRRARSRPTSGRWASGSASGRQAVAAAVAAADPAALAPRCATAARPRVDGRRRARSTLGADEVVVTETPREGWAVASGGGETVALDLERHPRAAPGRPGPRRRPAGAGRPQGQRPGGHRPDRAAGRRTDGEVAAAVREHAAAWRPRCWPTSFTEGSVGLGRGARGTTSSGWSSRWPRREDTMGRSAPRELSAGADRFGSGDTQRLKSLTSS